MITTDGNGNYSLGPKINKADGLQTLTGVLELTIGSDTDPAGQLILTSGTISTTLGLEIKPGNGSINLNNSQIQNMKSTLSSDSGQVAATKDYVDNSIAAATGGYGGRKPYTLQIDISGFTNTNAQVLGYVKQLLPVNGGDVIYYAQPPGARCNVLCASYTANSGTFTLSINENQIPAQSIVVSTGTSTVTITTGSGTSTTTSTQIVVTSTTWSTATTIVTSVAGTVTVTPPLNTVNYSIKQFQVISISTSAAQTVVTNFVSNGDASATSTGTLLTVSQTNGIYAGAVISGTGYTNGQIVVEVLSTQTVLTNTAPNATPSGSLSFTQVPGFNDWVFLRNL
jgi:hypothetical protein